MSSTRQGFFAVAFAVSWFFTGNLSAQPTYSFKYKDFYESAEKGSDEQLNAIIQIIDVLFRYDLDTAHGWSAKGLELAQANGKDRYLLTGSNPAGDLQVSDAAKIQWALTAWMTHEKTRAEWLQNVLPYLGLALMLIGLIASLIWNRNRLREVTTQLTDEKETSRINREMRDVLQDRVNQLQRMESLGMLAGGVAHDFNNLLVGVMGNAELLEQKIGSLDDFSAQRVQQIIASAEKAADLSRQMLAYVGKQPIARKPMDLNGIAKDMSRVLDATVGEKLELVIEPGSQPLVAEIDDTQIEQILLNLVSNASQASDDGAKVIVRTGFEKIDNVSADPNLHGTRHEGGEFVYLEVEDFGTGFDVDHSDRIFEPFYSISETGRGLGLSVVYGIVNGHDGLVRVTSKPGSGTSFRILLPKSSAIIESVPATKAPKFLNPQSQRGESVQGNVLVIDDEETVLELAEALLESKGWTVMKASNGRTGIELLRREHESIDCLLLDVVMPEIGAEDILKQLDEANIQLPIVLMSGYSDTQLDRFRKNKKIVSIISKPFRTSELAAAIEAAVSIRSTKNRRPA